MLPINTRNEIEASAYRKIAERLKDFSDGWDDFGIAASQIVEATERQLRRYTQEIESQLMRLEGTRWTRLPHVQVVYAHRSPRIVHSSGSSTYVSLNCYVQRYTCKPGEVYDFLCDVESKLFASEDELVVWRTGDLWTVRASDNQLALTTAYSLTHLYDGDVHTEPRQTRTVVADYLSRNTYDRSLKGK